MTESERLFRFVVTVYLCILQVLANDSWDRHLVLDHDGVFHLYWRSSEKEIIFKVEVAAKGYVGFGLSPHGGMAGSDIVTGWVANGKAYFQDRHGVGNAFPPKDKSQDWFLKSGWENDTHTCLTFYRKLETCDPDDLKIDSHTIRLIYAYSHTDPTSEDSLQYHGGYRGTRSTFLVQGSINRLTNLQGIPYWDIKGKNFSLTSQDRSVYWSGIYKFPHLNVKHHIIQISPLVQPENERYVHHMDVFECIDGVPEELERYANLSGFKQSDRNLPPSLYRCERLFALWCVGGEGTFLPEQAGFPLPANTTKYLRLEVHYDNPFLHDNIRDESGFRIYYTPKLRKYDAGMLSMTQFPTAALFIPPHMEEYIVATHSSQECFGKRMPPRGIKIWGAELHAHKLGRRIRVRHFRKNKELPPIVDERKYDFFHQDFKYLDKEASFLPMDQMTVECFYNSSLESKITFGGESTSSEMCVAFLLYYPRIKVSHSFSGPLLSTITNLTGASEKVRKDTSVSSEASALKSLKKHLETIDWSLWNMSVVQNTMRYAPQMVQCFPGFTHPGYEKMKKLVSYPKILVPYPEETPKCPENPGQKIIDFDVEVNNYL